MTIVYTTKAKEDLIRLDWKIRHKIIEELSIIEQNKDYAKLRKIYDSSYYKINYQNHLIIGKVQKTILSIISVVEKKKICLPV
jgi:mRNA-degrading endonuclease RelE of RelBE toxin-antitoxin system